MEELRYELRSEFKTQTLISNTRPVVLNSDSTLELSVQLFKNSNPIPGQLIYRSFLYMGPDMDTLLKALWVTVITSIGGEPLHLCCTASHEAQQICSVWGSTRTQVSSQSLCSGFSLALPCSLSHTLSSWLYGEVIYMGKIFTKHYQDLVTSPAKRNLFTFIYRLWRMRKFRLITLIT